MLVNQKSRLSDFLLLLIGEFNAWDNNSYLVMSRWLSILKNILISLIESKVWIIFFIDVLNF